MALDDGTAAATDTPEVVEPTDTPEVTPEVAQDVETPAVIEGAEPIEEVAAEPEAVELPTFDLTLPVEELVTQGTAVKDEFELPPQLTAYITALETKAAQPSAAFEPYADYGDEQHIKGALDHQNYLYSRRTEEGRIRRDTDKYVQELVTRDQEAADWLAYDVNQLPSQRYKGVSKFEEFIVDNFARPEDTVGSVLDRYHKLVEHMKTGTMPSTDLPSFIPDNLKNAYHALSKSARDEIALLEPDFEGDKIQDKLNDLRIIQEGLDNKTRVQETLYTQRQKEDQAFQQDVERNTTTFLTNFRTSFTEDMIANVKFSTDPKMQSLLATQQVALLAEAFDPSPLGEAARNALKEAGIGFDLQRATQLMSDVEKATIALISAKRQTGQNGEALNAVALNKARSEYERVGRNWNAYAKDILDQEARLVSTGSAKALEEAVKKQPILQKARAVPQSAASTVPTQRKPLEPPSNIQYGTQEWDKWWADQHIAGQAKKAQSYL